MEDKRERVQILERGFMAMGEPFFCIVFCNPVKIED